MSDLNNLYNNLTNFYNVNDENFKEFMAKFYEDVLMNHRDIEFVKEHMPEEIGKKVEKYFTDGNFNANQLQIKTMLILGSYKTRPTSGVTAGAVIYDTTLNKPVYWNGSKWCDFTGKPV